MNFITHLFQNDGRPGLLESPLDPRNVYVDELGGDEDLAPLPKSYRTEGLKFEPQGKWPFCVAMSITKMFEYAIFQKTGIHTEFSPPHLFFHGQGGINGSYVHLLLDLARKSGVVSLGHCPMPKNLWDASTFSEEKEDVLKVMFENTEKIPGYAYVTPRTDDLKRAIMKYGMVMVGVYAGGGYFGDRAKRANTRNNHLTLLVGWEEDGGWVIFDSVQPSKNLPYGGYHVLSSTYDFGTCAVLTELPADWKARRDEARSEPYAHCLNHYGKPMDFAAEVAFAAQMDAEFKKFNNQSVYEAAGKFWHVLTNMGVYGGYSLSYRKFGMWQPGDLINMIYHWRRTGVLLFDPNKTRAEYFR